MIKWKANCPARTGSHPIHPPEAALEKMKKLCLMIGNIRIHIKKKKR
jgi:hypothetical protein